MDIKKLLKSLVTYTEPKPYHQFELLEDEECEKKNDPTTKKEAEAQGASPDNPEPKKPLSFEEWNRKRQPGSKQSSADAEPASDSGPSDNNDSGSDKSGSSQDSRQKHPISRDLRENLATIRRELNSPTNQDVIIREFKVMQKRDAFLVLIDGMADNETINNFILRQLMANWQFGQCGNAAGVKKRDESESGQDGQEKGGAQTGQNKTDTSSVDCSVDFIAANLLSANQIKKVDDIDSAIKQVLNGLTAIFVDGDNACIIVETRGYESRSVSTPMTENVVKGPQEAFVENLRTNLTLIRKIIKSKDLITEIIPIGKIDQINCAIVYMKEIVNPKVVEEVKRRLNNLDIDVAIGDGVIDQLIEDHPFSIFPQIISTERPDRTASFLMDGKVALISDGSPFASVVPVTFFEMFHTSEDSTIRWQYGTFLRYVRIIASFFAVFLPGLYIALTLYHKEMIPNELMVSLHKARENVPFPTIVEVLLMEISFEIIREAGIRVPGVVGQTLGIIGAIVLGQAAVSAGLVSPVLIIIVAITGLGSFAIPDFSFAFALRILRFVFIFLGAMAGFYGISAGLFVFGGIACSMKSFGVPYLSPIAPKTKSNPNVINKAPVWMQKERPDYLNTRNRRRGGNPVRQWAEEAGGEKSQ